MTPPQRGTERHLAFAGAAGENVDKNEETKRKGGMIMKYLSIAVLAAFMLFGAAVSNAGEYHSSTSLICYDCHTMHFSMQHGWDGGAVGNAPVVGGNWLSANGPNAYLLKDEVNYLCLACHNGSSVAPDVLEANFNASPTQGRSAGALNEHNASPYQDWKGHTLGSTDSPPGDTSSFAGPLECTNCHTQHGRAAAYRNLGPRSISDTTLTYVISTTNDPSAHVWINIASGYTAGSGNPATFNPYYDTANINYNRINGTAADGSAYANGVTQVCNTCHGDFHGQPGDAGIGGTTAGAMERHPTAGVNIGDLGGGHSALSNYTGAVTKTKAAISDYTGYTGTSPICQSCHKSHGNQNPFGLIFLSRNATSVSEEGGYAAGQTADTQTGLRNLCGQCHRQGN